MIRVSILFWIATKRTARACATAVRLALRVANNSLGKSRRTQSGSCSQTGRVEILCISFFARAVLRTIGATLYLGMCASEFLSLWQQAKVVHLVLLSLLLIAYKTLI